MRRWGSHKFSLKVMKIFMFNEDLCHIKTCERGFVQSREELTQTQCLSRGERHSFSTRSGARPRGEPHSDGKSQTHQTTWMKHKEMTLSEKNPIPKGYSRCDSICTTLLARQNDRGGERAGVFWGVEGETEATEWGMRDPWGATELSCVLTGRVDQCHKTAQDKPHTHTRMSELR